MRPTPIPVQEVWKGAERVVFAAPDGDLTNPDIAPVEALVDTSPTTGARNISVRCELEVGDLEKLEAGGVVWLSFWGAMVPWSVTVVARADVLGPLAAGSVCPECRAGKCVNCDGSSWDVDADELATCVCRHEGSNR